jgi:hypothetical protein
MCSRGTEQHSTLAVTGQHSTLAVTWQHDYSGALAVLLRLKADSCTWAARYAVRTQSTASVIPIQSVASDSWQLASESMRLWSWSSSWSSSSSSTDVRAWVTVCHGHRHHSFVFYIIDLLSMYQSTYDIISCHICRLWYHRPPIINMYTVVSLTWCSISHIIVLDCDITYPEIYIYIIYYLCTMISYSDIMISEL